jgi:hypothetical protein
VLTKFDPPWRTQHRLAWKPALPFCGGQDASGTAWSSAGSSSLVGVAGVDVLGTGQVIPSRLAISSKIGVVLAVDVPDIVILPFRCR